MDISYYYINSLGKVFVGVLMDISYYYTSSLGKVCIGVEVIRLKVGCPDSASWQTPREVLFKQPIITV